MAGKEAALATLHDRHAAELWRFAMRLTHDREQAADVVQEVLLRAWKDPGLLQRDDAAARAWLFTATRNLVIDRWRSAQSRHEVTSGAMPEQSESDATSRVLDRWLIAEALSTLSEEHRAVIGAAYFEGRTVADIAGRLRIPGRHGEEPVALWTAHAALEVAGTGGDDDVSTQDYGSRAPSHEPDRYLQWDASYVLGALSSSERREFEHHMAGCRNCQRAVSELAGLPGLLAQVSPEDAALLTGAGDPPDAEPMPEFLPELTSRIHRRRRRLAVAIGSVAAALVLLFGGVGVLVSRGVIPIGTPSNFRVAFSPVVESGITANVDVTPGRSETKLQLECQYARSTTGSYSSEVSIWVRDRTGDESELFTWYAKPDKVMRPKTTAPMATRQIDRLELRDTHTGQILSTATLR